MCRVQSHTDSQVLAHVVIKLDGPRRMGCDVVLVGLSDTDRRRTVEAGSSVIEDAAIASE